MQLIKPDAAHEAAFRTFAEEFRHSQPDRFWRYALDGTDFAAFLAGLAWRAQPRWAATVPHTPEETFWLMHDAELLGVSRLRRDLLPDELHFDGHIGLEVRPSQRGRGVGTELLRRTCAVAFRRGVPWVELTALERNRASCRTIERCGGRVLGTVPDRDGAPLLRFRIDRPPGATEF